VSADVLRSAAAIVAAAIRTPVRLEISEYPAIYLDWGKRWTRSLPPLDAETLRNLAAVAAERRHERG
jgi:hypothetical protein